MYSKADVFLHSLSRSSHRSCSVKKGVLKNLTNFTEKQMWWSLFSIKFQTFSPATLLKIDSDTGVFLWIMRIFWEYLFSRTSVNDYFSRSGCLCLIWCFDIVFWTIWVLRTLKEEDSVTIWRQKLRDTRLRRYFNLFYIYFNIFAFRFKKEGLPLLCLFPLNSTVKQIEKSVIWNRLHVSKASWKFRIPTIYNFPVPVKFAIFLKSSLLFNSFYCLFCLWTKLYDSIA